jgi:Protein of unknown function (DUF3443)
MTRSPYTWVAVALLLVGLQACGGGGAGSSSAPPPPPLPTGSNVAPLTVDAGPTQLGVNLPSVSVKICAPGTAQCQIIDHILVDTGSTGLRLIASALTDPTVQLPAATTPTGDPLYECFTFADGYSWGSVRRADIQLADGQAANLSLQFIGDPAILTAPTDCSEDQSVSPPNPLSPQNTFAELGAKGILGVSVFLQDCGSACESVANPDGRGFYYACPGGLCTGTTIPVAAQLQNPVSQFPTNNNGVTLVLPALTAVGQDTVSGSFVLGIDSQSNNQLGGAVVLSVDPLSGNFTAIFNHQTYTMGASIDSGSNGNFFADTAVTSCTSALFSGWYCPATAVTLSVTNQGVGASSATSDVTFSVASIEALSNANPSFAAYNNIAGTLFQPIQGFDWGLPFFFGRSVSVAFEGKATAAGTGPFIAYADFL